MEPSLLDTEQGRAFRNTGTETAATPCNPPRGADPMQPPSADPSPPVFFSSAEAATPLPWHPFAVVPPFPVFSADHPHVTRRSHPPTCPDARYDPRVIVALSVPIPAVSPPKDAE